MTIPDLLVREMGCTMADFTRWLPGATRGAMVDTTDLALLAPASGVPAAGVRHRIQVGDGVVQIDLSPQPPRRIALLALPVMLASFRFIDLDAAQREDFLTYFDHYTRRGGG
jgi:hypothetical protein